jgi:hypothetical protein|tara:strand:+ start:92 stop:520 length:429 start_codon:yes stop_codon:yes gene_type:complete
MNYLEDLPINIKNLYVKNPKNMFSLLTNSVEVYYIIYNSHKKTIVNMGSSKAIGKNNNRIGSIHAEELAIRFCLKNDKKNKLKIFIWKWTNSGALKSKYCCYRCSLLIKKYNMCNKIFTFNENGKETAFITNPQNSLYYIMN